MKTDQEIFNYVYLALMRQNGRCVQKDGAGCAYRGRTTFTNQPAKCAAGHLIADEHYSPDFEGVSIFTSDEIVSNILELDLDEVKKDNEHKFFGAFSKRVGATVALLKSGISHPQLNLVRRMQIAHDMARDIFGTNNILERMAIVAEQMGLTLPV